jgi:hypothetical protein
LAVVADHIVLLPFFSHVVDHHFAWIGQNLRPECEGNINEY